MNLKLEMSRYWLEQEVKPNRAEISEDMILKINRKYNDDATFKVTEELLQLSLLLLLQKTKALFPLCLKLNRLIKTKVKLERNRFKRKFFDENAIQIRIIIIIIKILKK